MDQAWLLPIKIFARFSNKRVTKDFHVYFVSVGTAQNEGKNIANFVYDYTVELWKMLIWISTERS